MTVAAIGTTRRTPDRRVSLVCRTAGRGRHRHLAISVRGEVDAANAKEFADAVCSVVAGHRRIRLDLAELDFMAIDGVFALHAINAYLARAEAAWQAIAGPAVRRVLTLCDPEQLLPVDGPGRRPRPGRPALRLVKSA